MRVPNALAAAGIATSAVLLLASCGSSESKSPDKIAGVSTSAPSATASPTATASAGRSTISLPADLTLIFDPTRTGDAKKDAVLADNAQYVRSVDAAIVANNPKDPLLSLYSSGRALEGAVSWVQQFKKANWTVTGIVRYYDRKVTLSADGSATLVYCSDESKGYGRDRKTGRVQVTKPSKTDFVIYNTRLDKNVQGIWQTTEILSQRGAAQCQS